MKWIFIFLVFAFGSASAQVGTDTVYFFKVIKTRAARIDTLAVKHLTGVTVAGGVDSIWRVPGVDSFYWRKDNVTRAVKDSTGGTPSIRTVNDSTLIGGTDLRLFYVRALTADTTNSSTVAKGSGLSFPIKANERWNVVIEGTAAKSGATSGMRVGIDGPSGCTVRGFQQHGTAALSTAMQNGLVTTLGALGTTFATGNNVEVPFRVSVLVTNGSTAGTVELIFATVTSQEARLFTGTRLTALPVANEAP